MGPVHEKETSTNVKAIKKIQISPPLSAFLFILFTNDEGNTISKAPKNDNAKIKNIIKNMIFAIALVAKSLATSAPKSTDTPIPTIV